MKYQLGVKKFADGTLFLYIAWLPDKVRSVGGLIDDVASSRSEEYLLKFVEAVVNNKNQIDTLRFNVYRIEIVQEREKKIFKITNELMKLSGEPYDECYISPQDLKELLKIWIKERKEFKKNPVEYKEKLKKRGGIIEE